MQLRCADRVLALDRPVVMGVLNVTPDSFSDGGRYLRPDGGAGARPSTWWRRARPSSIWAGSRPGRARAGHRRDEELRRVLPVIERVAARLPALICRRHLQSRGHAPRAARAART